MYEHVFNLHEEEKLEIEADVFDHDQGWVVSVACEDGTTSSLATLLPEEAREVAKVLLMLADKVEALRADSSA